MTCESWRGMFVLYPYAIQPLRFHSVCIPNRTFYSVSGTCVGSTSVFSVILIPLSFKCLRRTNVKKILCGFTAFGDNCLPHITLVMGRLPVQLWLLYSSPLTLQRTGKKSGPDARTWCKTGISCKTFNVHLTPQSPKGMHNATLLSVSFLMFSNMSGGMVPHATKRHCTASK